MSHESLVVRILDLGAGWIGVISFTFQSLCFRRSEVQFSLDRGMSGPQSRYKRGGEKKKSPSFVGNRTLVFKPPFSHLIDLNIPVFICTHM
jgi:hypothetical protein